MTTTPAVLLAEDEASWAGALDTLEAELARAESLLVGLVDSTLDVPAGAGADAASPEREVAGTWHPPAHLPTVGGDAAHALVERTARVLARQDALVRALTAAVATTRRHRGLVEAMSGSPRAHFVDAQA